MATLDIIEYDGLVTDGNGHAIPAGIEPARAVQQITIGGTSAASAVFSGATRLVRLHADAACRIAFGENPTASATSARLAANATEFFGVRAGMKIAVITSA